MDDPEDPLETLNNLKMLKEMELQEYEKAIPKRRKPPRVEECSGGII